LHDGSITAGAGLPLRITRNCEAALRQLRFCDRLSTLWVDDLCIDQASGEDKESQLPLMKDIFESAERVVLWIGLPTKTTKSAVNQIEAGNQMMLLYELTNQVGMGFVWDYATLYTSLCVFLRKCFFSFGPALFSSSPPQTLVHASGPRKRRRLPYL
jgi:hypothetical protein